MTMGRGILFTKKGERSISASEIEVKELHAKIGQLTIGMIFYQKPSADEPQSKDIHGLQGPSEAQCCLSMPAAWA